MKDKKIELSSPTIPDHNGFNVEDLDRFKNGDYYKYIVNFYNTMLKSVTQDELNLFYNNIRTLEIVDKKYLFGARGEYANIDNKIYLIKGLFDKDAINHEQLHMSSSIYNPDKDVVYSGLSYYSKKLKLGDGLNEGYTELLNRRFFDSRTDGHFYECQIVLAKLVEKIVGKEAMTKLYFTADLNSLMKILQIYNSEMPSYKFIKYVDKTIESDIFIVRKFKEDFNTDYFKYITTYLIKTYTNKLYLEYLSGRLTEDEYIRNIDYYYDSVFDIFKIKEGYRPRFNEYCIMNNIENYYNSAKALVRK